MCLAQGHNTVRVDPDETGRMSNSVDPDFVLFDFTLYVPVNNFSVMSEGSSWDMSCFRTQRSEGRSR